MSVAAPGFQSFDQQVAALAGLDAERAPQQQRITNPTTPNPGQLISDHEPNGAWLPPDRNLPGNPPAPPSWIADHGDIFGYAPATNADDPHVLQALGPHGTDNHGGRDDNYVDYDWGPNSAQPNIYPLMNIGHPFTVTEHRQRHLRTAVYDSTGKIVNPPSSPSAPMQIYGSQHHTTPRFIGFDLTPLFENTGKAGQFSQNPGYLGVSDNAPNRAPRQYGSVAAQMPDDPYVNQGAAAGDNYVDYSGPF
jgi:hypothetical protein